MFAWWLVVTGFCFYFTITGRSFISHCVLSPSPSKAHPRPWKVLNLSLHGRWAKTAVTLVAQRELPRPPPDPPHTLVLSLSLQTIALMRFLIHPTSDIYKIMYIPPCLSPLSEYIFHKVRELVQGQGIGLGSLAQPLTLRAWNCLVYSGLSITFVWNEWICDWMGWK